MSDVASVSEHACGTVKFYIPDKGYGFIARDGGACDVFVHANELKRAGIAAPSIAVGSKLEFDIEPNDKGPKAVNIKQVA